MTLQTIRQAAPFVMRTCRLRPKPPVRSMHELSIARSILETVLREQQQRSLPAVTEIGVRFGALSGVLPDALSFSFEAIVAGTSLDGCRFVIEQVPLQGTCAACGEPFTVDDLVFSCLACGSGRIDLSHGYEMDIAYLEVEDPP